MADDMVAESCGFWRVWASGQRWEFSTRGSPAKKRASKFARLPNRDATW